MDWRLLTSVLFISSRGFLIQLNKNLWRALAFLESFTEAQVFQSWFMVLVCHANKTGNYWILNSFLRLSASYDLVSVVPVFFTGWFCVRKICLCFSSKLILIKYGDSEPLHYILCYNFSNTEPPVIKLLNGPSGRSFCAGLVLVLCFQRITSHFLKCSMP